MVSKLIKGAVRIKRLLEISNNDYNILDTFLDLKIEFFTTTSMSAINYERWLKLVQSIRLFFLRKEKFYIRSIKLQVRRKEWNNF